ncbi:RNA 3'-terminal phosphate cyclase [Zavarzinella formosa]|uniref:RNA 3'-terminal phosphate cyclase n=1 Tax=Zavarzinella formosa TaxID=360055 RepID=UPI0002EEAC4E|nr:RNA 3'-terminal phosphate cyclase [Zavarzinella formosa]
MLVIDGSQGEGGGQILRTSLAMSLLTKTPIQIHKIRANRTPKPGLQAQHLTCVRAAAEIGNARVDGDRLGSSHLSFIPGEIVGGTYRFPIRTAGATSLVLHTVYLPLALGTKAASRVVIEGGTHVINAPSYHFLERTWAKAMSLTGLSITLQMHRPGFYPRGGGEIEAEIRPVERLSPINLTEPVKHTCAEVVGAVAGLDPDIGKRLGRKAAVLLRDLGLEAEPTVEEWSGGPSCVMMATLTNGPIPALVCGLGSRGKPADAVSTEAIDELKPHLLSQAPVDPHTADQLLLPLAFADGESVFRVSEVTQHLLTNAIVIHLFNKATIEIDGEEGSPGVVRVRPYGV